LAAREGRGAHRLLHWLLGRIGCERGKKCAPLAALVAREDWLLEKEELRTTCCTGWCRSRCTSYTLHTATRPSAAPFPAAGSKCATPCHSSHTTPWPSRHPSHGLQFIQRSVAGLMVSRGPHGLQFIQRAKLNGTPRESAKFCLERKHCTEARTSSTWLIRGAGC
jgi:hypothetical protein